MDDSLDLGALDFDGLAAAAGDGPGGVVWSLAGAEQLNVNLVALPSDGAIGEHGNDSVEVLVVGLAGSVAVTVDGRTTVVGPRQAAFVPIHTRRSLRAGPEGTRYLTVHVRRPPLGVRPNP